MLSDGVPYRIVFGVPSEKSYYKLQIANSIFVDGPCGIVGTQRFQLASPGKYLPS